MLGVALFLIVHPRVLVDVSPSDANIRYEGRWDRRDPLQPQCEWSATAVALRFVGTDLSVQMTPSQNLWVVEVDGTATKKIAITSADPVILAGGLPNGIHTVRLVKATEPFVGAARLIGFDIEPSERLSRVPITKHRLEVIGDSISCGYGNEGKNEKEHFSPQTENAYLSYGAIAARQLHSDYTCIAWSGRKMWPDNTVPSIYDLACPTDPSSVWSFPAPPPDAIVINLATNDFGKENPDEAGWTGAYESFIAQLRTHAPKARIYVASGTMMSDAWPPNHHALTTLRGYLRRIVADRAAAGDSNVAVLDFGVQDGARDGLGSDYHPNLVTHAKMGAQLAQQIHKDLRW